MIIRIKQGQTAPFALRILSAKGAETETVFFTVQALASELANADTERVCVSIPDTSDPESVRAQVEKFMNKAPAKSNPETVKAVLQKSAEMRKRADAERAKVFHEKPATEIPVCLFIAQQNSKRAKNRIKFGFEMPYMSVYAEFLFGGTTFQAICEPCISPKGELRAKVRKKDTNCWADPTPNLTAVFVKELEKAQTRNAIKLFPWGVEMVSHEDPVARAKERAEFAHAHANVSGACRPAFGAGKAMKRNAKRHQNKTLNNTIQNYEYTRFNIRNYPGQSAYQIEYLNGTRNR